MAERNNKALIAQLLNVNTARVEWLVKERIIPPPDNGNYNVPRVVQSYIAYLKEQADNPVVNASDLAKYLNISQPAVSTLTKRGILTKKAKGRYDVKTNTTAYIEYWKGKTSKNGMPTDIAEEQLLLKREQRLMAKIQREQLERKAVPITECEAGWITLASMAATALDTLASRLGYTLSPEQRELVDNEARRARQELSDELTSLATAVRDVG
jgi:phage terminase Nu1 subunit (DNA packaging protein)